VSIVAVGLYFVPILIVIIKKLWSQLAFRLFALYWLISALANLLEFIPLPRSTAVMLTIIYNTADIPMVLGVFYCITRSSLLKKINKVAIPLILLSELTSFIIYGFTYDALKYALGGSLLVILAIIICEIILKLQKIRISGADRGLLLIYAAMLFEYGTYVVIYIFDFFLPNVSSQTDSWLVYYLSSIIALSVAICGFLTRGINAPARQPADHFETPKVRQLELGLRYWE
jgi:hypothetical protein